MTEPAHKILIDRYINWNLVKERLNRYENIGKFFALKYLQDCSTKAPYYCHYLAFRLGTWNDEQWFEFFDTLLAKASKLPNWTKNRIPYGCEFENFWSFLWELQVAQLFANYSNTNIEWLNSGPDLKVTCDAGQFFVECTIYRKSFGLEEFIGNLLSLIHPSIRVQHTPFMKYSLPKNQNVEGFLDELFEQFIDQSYLEAKLKEAEKFSPLVLPVPKDANNFYVFIENQNAEDFNPNQPWASTGEPEDFLEVVTKEILFNKKTSNQLITHRPNLLAANLLLGRDFQLALAINRSVPNFDLGSEYDAVMLAACGIDETPKLKEAKMLRYYESHPINYLLNL
jgi:hypothetical protein